jgi:hypothetical protein
LPGEDLGGHHRGRHEAAFRSAHGADERPALFHHGRDHRVRRERSGKTIDIDGMELTERASIDLGLFDLLHRPYRETTIDRDTVYRFKAGSPVFLLEGPDGSRYVMQAYAQIVDKTLTYDDLPALGAKLKLPSGWRYSTTIPQQDIVAGAKGKATVVQDDLDNTYQKLD